LFFIGFLKISLKTVYPTIGIDRKRYEKMGIDGGPIGECGFSCDATNTHMLLNSSFPYLWGRGCGLCQSCGFGGVNRVVWSLVAPRPFILLS